ncbi:transcription factor MYB34 [Gossypium australe]|uniref:Transcription factor MYB34 n=1 Tax=Gossypium australe TaxID=47621 RepID=A0A5B6ULV5_9ROSI|nr:transcription factor MYB34 [Gossypium australe]
MNQNLREDVSNNTQNPILVADDIDRAIRQYVVPLFSELNLGNVRPKIEAPQFGLKLVMFQMLQTIKQFSGMSTEDPHMHLHLFMEWPTNRAATGRRVAGVHEVDVLTALTAQVLEIRVVEAKGGPLVVHNQKEVQPEVEAPTVQNPVPVTPTEVELE